MFFVSSVLSVAHFVRSFKGLHAHLNPLRWGRHSCLPRTAGPILLRLRRGSTELAEVRAGRNARPTKLAHMCLASPPIQHSMFDVECSMFSFSPHPLAPADFQNFSSRRPTACPANT